MLRGDLLIQHRPLLRPDTHRVVIPHWPPPPPGALPISDDDSVPDTVSLSSNDDGYAYPAPPRGVTAVLRFSDAGVQGVMEINQQPNYHFLGMVGEGGLPHHADWELNVYVALAPRLRASWGDGMLWYALVMP